MKFLIFSFGPQNDFKMILNKKKKKRKTFFFLDFCGMVFDVNILNKLILGSEFILSLCAFIIFCFISISKLNLRSCFCFFMQHGDLVISTNQITFIYILKRMLQCQ